MKDTKFTELLNLYLDHQITPEETALLEAEIQRNPARRAVYRQYCRMHKACSQVASHFQENAPARRPVRTAARPRRTAAAFYATGLMAAAACVAVVLVNMPGGGESAPAGNFAAMASAAPDEAFAVAPPQQPVMPALAPRIAELHTVFSTRALAQLGEDSVPEAMIAAGRERFDWMNQMQLIPLQAEPLIFESGPTLTPDARTFRSQRPYYGTAEMTAFQFQR